MGKFAFHGIGKYPDFKPGYDLYLKRCKKTIPADERVYRQVVLEYCRGLASRLEKDGMADMPNSIGTLFTAIIDKKPQYRGNRFIGYGKVDWSSKHFDGSHNAFGVVFLPNRNKSNNLRCYGFVSNRRLFERLKKEYINQTVDWKPMNFNEEMI